MMTHAIAPLLAMTLVGSAVAEPSFRVQTGPVRPETRFEEWQAQWIWGPEKTHGHDGFFRKTIELEETPERAQVQMSGDDQYTLFINGQEIKTGGFWWKTTDRLDVTDSLRQGTNVLACRINNAAHPGGWLMEITINLPSRKTLIVGTDPSWRFSTTVPEGWLTSGFDDKGWTECVSMGSPPQAKPWGELPHEFQGRRSEVEMLSSKSPQEISAGEPVTGSLCLRLSKPLPEDVGLSWVLKLKDKEMRRERWALTPPPQEWPVGQTIQIEIPPIPMSQFLPGDTYTLEILLSRAKPSGSKESALIRAPLVVKNPRQGLVTDVAIRPWKGAPALFMSGKPQFPLWFWQTEISPADAKAFRTAGVTTFTFSSPSYYLSPGWVQDKTYDYTEWDAIMMRFLESCPDGFCVPRIFVGAPNWWLDQHPDQSCQYATGKGWEENGWGGTKHESFASELWRREAGEALNQFVQHIMKSSYSDRIIGIHVANGIYGEWHTWSATDIPDTSEPMRQALSGYVREKYRDDVDALRKSWKIQDLAFDGVTIPDLKERHAGDVGMFRDPALSNKVSDYYDCLHQETAEAIDHFCGMVKKASEGRLLTLVFYSYTPDLDWPQEGDHRAAAQVHRMSSVDMFASPHSYARRALKQDGLFRNYPASLQLHGKLFMDEADDRTHKAQDPTFTHVTTLDQSLQVMRRELANAVTHGVGLWYMDQQGDWFHDEAMMSEMARLKALGDLSMNMPRQSVAEVAVISCLKSEFYLAGRDSGKNRVTFPLYNDQIGELCRSGAPFDWYLVEDLAEGLVPDHKVYVFLDAFALSDEERKAIEGLKSQNRTLVWFFAPGTITPSGLSLDAMASLVGLPMAQKPSGPLRIRVGEDLSFGPQGEQSPRFQVKPGSGDVWGTFEGGEPGLVVATLPGWRSVYCGSPGLPADLLRRIDREAGVHVYSDEGDNLTANASWVALHTSSSGLKTLRLPGPRRVYDVFNKRSMGENVSEFQIQLEEGVTALFALDPPEDIAK